ncbi:SMP-30/gluconolactonase/LRE family protein [Marinimicrobium alkaliphilum]|uniref:SMP-30/gluconolactonase/LRE family protein n=1 Tax=Marinimicrobium alkaliphilum TaxID=2202654 RepID=UPI000DBA95D8|nr:SMP-30/gluconolactonase/LRE family protein [Marinimicrobium alkaliphilum]
MKPKHLLALGVLAAIHTGHAHPPTQDYIDAGRFTDGIEGPAFGPDGRLYVPNLKTQGTIGVVSAQGQADIFMRLPEGSIGNAIRFNAEGDMLVADYTGHNVHVIDLESRAIRHTYHQPAMHQPNDIAVSRSGMIYASDPDWSTDSGQLWRISPEGEIVLLECGMGTTNGIELSPDETRLYVNESVQRKVWVYDVSPEGDISNKQLFHQFDDYGLDGMKTDRTGNLYIARYGAGRITVLSPEGEVINRFPLQGQHPTNLALKENESTRVYVTLQQRGAIETFTVE